MAQVDPYFDAEGRAEAQRKALLADMAKRGSQAKADHEAAQAQVAQSRQAAVQATLADAARRNAPAALMPQLGSTVATPYDRRSADMDRANETRASALQVMQSANNDYMGQVSAAVPIQRAISEREKAERDQQEALERELAQMRLTEARESRDFAREEREWEREQRLAGGGLGDLSDSELQNYLMGAAANVRSTANQDAYDRAKRGMTGWARGYFKGPRTDAQEVAIANPTDEALALELGKYAGVDPNRVRGVVGEPKAADAEAKKEGDLKDHEVKATSYYKNIAGKFLQALESTDDPFAARDALIEQYGTRYPRSVQLLLAEYKHLFTD